MKRKPKDPCSPHSRKHKAAVAYLASRGITQPKPTYPILTAIEPVRLPFRLVGRARAAS